MMERIEILGVQIDNVTSEEALDRIREMVHSGSPHQIVTPAIEQVVRGRRDPEFNQVLSEAEMVLADGMPVVFASKWSKTPLKERITGVDSIPALCRMAEQENFSVFFMGGEEGVAEETAAWCRQQFPKLKIAGTYCPPYQFELDPAQENQAIDIVRQAQPDILFLAISSPRAEKWLHRRKQELGVPVMMGIGGAFNFITGREKRAPQWIQNLGLEGIYRLAQRPGEIWKRILFNAPYFFLVFFDLLSYRLQKRFTYGGRPLGLALFDAMLAPAAFVFSYWLYFRSGVFTNQADPFPEIQSLLAIPAYSELLWIVVLLGVFSLWLMNLYARNKYISKRGIVFQTLKASILTVFLLICFQFIFLKTYLQEYQFLGFSRMVFGLFGGFLFLFWAVWRCFFHSLEQQLHRMGLSLDRIIIVGVNTSAQTINAELQNRPELGIVPIGFIDPETTESTDPP
ncbi:WecB/TagA/CpsF family glycosyltransferase, partial [bacterium]|nr:WecB/TagA/CpsF family glycosyltransferase [bacterium]